MTQPEPAPGAPEETQPIEQAEQSTQAEDVNALPDWAQKLIREARADAAKSRTTAKQTAAEEARKAAYAEIAKKLGLTNEGEEVSQEEMDARLVQAQQEAFQSRVESQMTRLATRLGFDADAAMDSNRFMDDLAAALDEKDDNSPEHIANLDPRSSAFAAELERALTSVLDKHPRFKARRFSGGADNGPREGSGKPEQLTENDLKRMTPQQIEAARVAGKLNDLLGVS